MAKLLEADLVVSRGTGLLINAVIPYRRQPIFSACVSLPAASQPCPVALQIPSWSPWQRGSCCGIALLGAEASLLPLGHEISRETFHLLPVSFACTQRCGFSSWVVLGTTAALPVCWARSCELAVLYTGGALRK